MYSWYEVIVLYTLLLEHTIYPVIIVFSYLSTLSGQRTIAEMLTSVEPADFGTDWFALFAAPIIRSSAITSHPATPDQQCFLSQQVQQCGLLLVQCCVPTSARHVDVACNPDAGVTLLIPTRSPTYTMSSASEAGPPGLLFWQLFVCHCPSQLSPNG